MQSDDPLSEVVDDPDLVEGVQVDRVPANACLDKDCDRYPPYCRAGLQKPPDCWNIEFQLDAIIADDFGHMINLSVNIRKFYPNCLSNLSAEILCSSSLGVSACLPQSTHLQGVNIIVAMHLLLQLHGSITFCTSIFLLPAVSN